MKVLTSNQIETIYICILNDKHTNIQIIKNMIELRICNSRWIATDNDSWRYCGNIK